MRLYGKMDLKTDNVLRDLRLYTRGIIRQDPQAPHGVLLFVVIYGQTSAAPQVLSTRSKSSLSFRKEHEEEFLKLQDSNVHFVDLPHSMNWRLKRLED